MRFTAVAQLLEVDSYAVVAGGEQGSLLVESSLSHLKSKAT